MAVLFRFEVHTPYRLFFSEQVEAIVLSLPDGEAGIYAGHAPFTAPVIPCLFRIKDKNGKWKTAFTAEGILEVKGGTTILVSESAEWPEEIDCERARNAKERAEKTLSEPTLKFEAETAAMSLRRAELRLKAGEQAAKG